MDTAISGDQEWAGTLTLNGRTEFIRWTFRPDGRAHMDRPGILQFGLPLIGAPVRRSGWTALQAGTFSFRGTFADKHFIGSATDGANEGACELWCVQDPDPATIRPLIGHYQIGSMREIAFSRANVLDAHLLYYAEGDQLVRLYAIGERRFLSERCELVAAPKEGADCVLQWAQYGASAVPSLPVRHWTEEEVRVPVAGFALGGTLLLPPGPGPHPAILLCHHASIHERDYYRLFAEPFVRHGIAALIYDKRGRGASGGTPLFSDIYPLSEDAVAVFRWLQAHPAIAAARVGLWGISNGAWVTALAGDRVGDAAFLIAASGAGVSPAQQEQFRRVNVARALGASPRAAALLERFWGRFFQFEIDGEWTTDLEQLLTQVNGDDELQRLPRHPTHGPGLQPVPPIRPSPELQSKYGGQWPEAAFDPAPVYGRQRCPILCVWGADDDVVLPEESKQRIGQALAGNRHPDFQLLIMPQATHMLYVTPAEASGMLAETMQSEMHDACIAPGVRELMAGWAAQRAPAS